MRKDIIYIILAILTLPIILFAGRQIQQFISQAAPKKANIVIDAKNILEPVTYPWAAFAQGGEESPPMLSPVTSLLRQLTPRYIRLDHIYDSYSVVQRTNQGYSYDFTRLDKTVDDIIASGALPFFSLSYMPAGFTLSGSITDPPKNWNDWKDLVKATIEHYSGKNNRNLINVYYEVWNEPELPKFGGWKLLGEKDYRLLYFYAASGANEASNVNNFYLGGPSVGSYYSSWVNDFLSYVSANNLRLDFYSWHRYTKKPQEYLSDTQKIRKDLAKFPKYSNIPLILSEWAFESENLEINSSHIAAAFSISAISKFYQDISLAFAFEIKDGPPPMGGKWGLVTHEKDTNKPLSPKPRYKAFEALSKLKGKSLFISGEGTFIWGIASVNGSDIFLLITNYDPKEQNTENVPITFTGLSPSSYKLKYIYPLEDTSGEYEIATTNGVISKSFLLSQNSLLFIELSPVAELATFIPGLSNTPTDQALVLKNQKSPLVFTFPEFHLLPKGSLEFDINFLWDERDTSSFSIFESVYSLDEKEQKTIFLRKENDSSGNLLSFGITSENEVTKVSLPITHPTKEWKHIIASWDQSSLSLSLDEASKSLETPLDIRNGKTFIFYPAAVALDNLKIEVGKEQLLERKFDGRIDK